MLYSNNISHNHGIVGASHNYGIIMVIVKYNIVKH
jgi:hypothetical protein